MNRAIRVLIVPAAIVAVVGCTAPAAPTITGRWRAWLDSPGGELPFGLEIEPGPVAFLINGDERIRVPALALDGRRVRLEIDHYDSTIAAESSRDGRRLEGVWTKVSGPGEQSRLDFHAVRGDAPRFAADATTVSGATIDGRWLVDFAKSDEPAVAVFDSRPDGTLTGTFMTTTGDYRYLAGRIGGDRLRLSCFDGAHAFLFDARLGDDDVTLPDAFELTSWVAGVALEDLVYPDLDGRERSLADLDRRYGDRGLSILGLAFEVTGEFERDAAQVRRYRAHHGLDFPVLVAGRSDKTEASTGSGKILMARGDTTT